MTKPARLKEWHTLQDAAHYLSNKLKEEISATDILQFGLQGNLVWERRLCWSQLPIT